MILIKTLISINLIPINNFIKWIEKRFSLDKSFSPISPIIKRLEIELARYYKNRNIKVFINPGSSNGEADLKIFQFIQNENLTGDVLIHTTDSDFIHLMLIQQVYFNFKRISFKEKAKRNFRPIFIDEIRSI